LTDDESFAGRGVKIMPDIYASGVWNQEGVECCLTSLPIPQGLRDRIEAWQAEYNKLELRWDDGEIVDWRPFGAVGLAIARQVKAFLPDWTVVYCNEAHYYRGDGVAYAITIE